jgi:prepilin-type N-terminal cleavage/methylation domain-containing protein
MANHSRSCGTCGYSLLELVTVIAVLAILTASATPALVTLSYRTALRSEAAAVSLFFERAYSYSINIQERVDVSVLERRLVARNQAGTPLSDYALKYGVSVRDASTKERIISLFPSISASPQTVELSKGSQTCSVVASLRGRFRTTC